MLRPPVDPQRPRRSPTIGAASAGNGTQRAGGVWDASTGAVSSTGFSKESKSKMSTTGALADDEEETLSTAFPPDFISLGTPSAVSNMDNISVTAAAIAAVKDQQRHHDRDDTSQQSQSRSIRDNSQDLLGHRTDEERDSELDTIFFAQSSRDSNPASSSNPTEPLAGDAIMDFDGIDRYVTMEHTYSADSINDDQQATLRKLASITAERDKAQLELSQNMVHQEKLNEAIADRDKLKLEFEKIKIQKEQDDKQRDELNYQFERQQKHVQDLKLELAETRLKVEQEVNKRKDVSQEKDHLELKVKQIELERNSAIGNVKKMKAAFKSFKEERKAILKLQQEAQQKEKGTEEKVKLKKDLQKAIHDKNEAIETSRKLKAIVKNLREERQNFLTTATALETTLAEGSADKEALKGQLHKALCDVQAVSEEKKHVLATVDGLKAALSEERSNASREKEKERLLSEIDEVQKLFVAVSKEREKVTEQLTSLQSENQDLSRRLHESTTVKEESSSHSNDKTAVDETDSNHSSDIDSQCTHPLTENDVRKKIMHTCDADSSCTIPVSNRKYNQLNRRRKLESKLRDQLKATSSKITTNMSDQTRTLEEMRSSRDTYLKRAEDSEAQLNKAKEEISNLSNKINHLQADQISNGVDLKKVMRKNQNEQEEPKICTINEMEYLTCTLSQLQTEKDTVALKLEELESNFQDAQEKLSLTYTERDALRRDLEQYQTKVAELESTCSGIQQSKSQNAETMLEINNLKSTLQSTQEQLKLAQAERDVLSKMLEESKAKLALLEPVSGINKEATKDEKTPKNGLQQSKSQNAETMLEINNLKSTLQSTQEQLKLAQAERDTLSKMLEESKAKLAHLEPTSVSGTKGEATKDEKTLKTELLESTLQNTREELKLACTERDVLSNMVQQQQSKVMELESMNSSRLAVEAERNDMAAKIEKLESNLRNTEEKLVLANTKQNAEAQTVSAERQIMPISTNGKANAQWSITQDEDKALHIRQRSAILDDRIEQLLSQKNVIEKQLQVSSSAKRGVILKTQQLKNEKHRVENMINELEFAASTWDKSSKEQRFNAKRITAERDDLAKQVEVMTLKSNNLETEAAQLSSSMDTLQSEKDGIEDDLRVAIVEKEEIARELLDLKNDKNYMLPEELMEARNATKEQNTKPSFPAAMQVKAVREGESVKTDASEQNIAVLEDPENLEGLLSSLKDVEGKLTTAEGRIDTLQKNESKLKCSLDMAEDRYRAALDDAEDLKIKIKSMQSTEMCLQERIEVLETNVLDTTSVSSSLKDVNVDVDKLEELQGAVIELEANCQELEISLEKVSREKESAKGQLKIFLAWIDDLQTKLQMPPEQNKSPEETPAPVFTSAEAVSSQAELEAKLQRITQVMVKKDEELTRNVTEMKKEKKSVTFKLSEDDDTTKFSNFTEELIATKKKRENRTVILQNLIEESEQEKEVLSTEVVDRDLKIIDKVREVKAAESRIAVLQDRIVDLQTQYQELQITLEKAVSERGSAQIHLKVYEAWTNDLQTKLQMPHEDIKSSEESRSVILTSSSTTVEAAASSHGKLEAKLQRMTEMMAMKGEELTNNVDKLKKKNKSIKQDNMRQLLEEKKDSESSLSQARDEIRKISEERDRLSQELKASVTSHNEANEELKKVESNLVDIKAKFDKIQKYSLGLEQQLEVVSVVEKGLAGTRKNSGDRQIMAIAAQAKLEVYRKRQEDLEFEITNLTKKLESARASLASSEANKDASERKSKDLLTNLESVSQESKELKKQVSILKDENVQLEKSIKLVHRRKLDLTSELVDRDMKLSAIRKELQKAYSAIGDFKITEQTQDLVDRLQIVETCSDIDTNHECFEVKLADESGSVDSFDFTALLSASCEFPDRIKGLVSERNYLATKLSDNQVKLDAVVREKCALQSLLKHSATDRADIYDMQNTEAAATQRRNHIDELPIVETTGNRIMPDTTYSTLRNLRQDSSSFDAEIAERHLSDMQQQLQGLVSENQKLLQRLSEVQLEKRDLEGKLESRKENNQENEAKLREAVVDSSKANQTQPIDVEADAIIKGLMQSIAELESEKDREMSEMKSERQKVESRLKRSMAQIATLQEENEGLLKKITESSSTGAAVVDSSSTDTANQTNTTKKTLTSEERQTRNVSIATLRSEKDCLGGNEQSIRALQEENGKLEEKLKSYFKANEQEKKRAADFENQVHSLEEKLEESTLKNSMLKNEIERCLGEMKSFQDQLVELEAAEEEVANLRTRILELEGGQSLASNEADKTGFTKDDSSISVAPFDEVNDRDTKFKRMQENLFQKEEELREANEELLQQKDEIDRFDAQVQVMKYTLHKRDQEMNAATKQIVYLECKLNSISDLVDIDDIRGGVNKVINEKEEIQERLERIQEEKLITLEQLEQERTKVKKLKNEVNFLKWNLKKSETENNKQKEAADQLIKNVKADKIEDSAKRETETESKEREISENMKNAAPTVRKGRFLRSPIKRRTKSSDARSTTSAETERTDSTIESKFGKISFIRSRSKSRTRSKSASKALSRGKDTTPDAADASKGKEDGKSKLWLRGRSRSISESTSVLSRQKKPVVAEREPGFSALQSFGEGMIGRDPSRSLVQSEGSTSPAKEVQSNATQESTSLNRSSSVSEDKGSNSPSISKKGEESVVQKNVTEPYEDPSPSFAKARSFFAEKSGDDKNTDADMKRNSERIKTPSSNNPTSRTSADESSTDNDRVTPDKTENQAWEQSPEILNAGFKKEQDLVAEWHQCKQRRKKERAQVLL